MALSPQWEYLTVLVDVSPAMLANEILHPYSVNGQVLNNWKKLDLNIFLSELGIDHWEMTGTISIPRASIAQGSAGAIANCLFFKRIKP